MEEQRYLTDDLFICELYKVKEEKIIDNKMYRFKTPKYRIMKKIVQNDLEDDFFYVYYSDIYGNGDYGSTINLRHAIDEEILAEPIVNISKYGKSLTLPEIEEVYDAFIFEKKINELLEENNLEVLRAFKKLFEGNSEDLLGYVENLAHEADSITKSRKK